MIYTTRAMQSAQSQTNLSSSTASQRMQQQILQVAGGDPSVAQMLRGMLWDAYLHANCPFGSSEEGLFIWWEHQKQTRRD